MRAGVAIAAAAISAGSTAAAFAAYAKEDVAVRKITFDYARCVVQAHHDSASQAIVADEGNNTIAHRYSELIDSDCLGRTGGNVQMRFGGDLYRYALADALVNRDFAAGGPDDFSDRLPLAHLLPPSQSELDAEMAKTKSGARRKELQDRFDREMGAVWLSRYGECIARLDPVDARLWVLTPPGRPEETSRINSLRPAFASCLKNGTLSFNRTTMRGTVALNYYRLAMATSVPAARKAN